MCRIKNRAILLGLCMVITACGSSEQQKSKVMLYQGDKNKKEEEHYKTTKVKKGTYEEKISATASLVYQNDKAVMIKDSNAYLDKILVKNGQKVCLLYTSLMQLTRVLETSYDYLLEGHAEF